MFPAETKSSIEARQMQNKHHKLFWFQPISFHHQLNLQLGYWHNLYEYECGK